MCSQSWQLVSALRQRSLLAELSGLRDPRLWSAVYSDVAKREKKKEKKEKKISEEPEEQHEICTTALASLLRA
jgi:hypothetical protein